MKESTFSPPLPLKNPCNRLSMPGLTQAVFHTLPLPALQTRQRLFVLAVVKPEGGHAADAHCLSHLVAV